MSSTDVPEPWASRMIERRFIDPRSKIADVPSMSALAAATNLHTSTISGVIYGRRRASAETTMALVEALGPDVQDWLGARVELGKYVAPPESALLTGRQRKALTELIRSMVTDEQEGGGGHVGPAATREADDRPASLPGGRDRIVTPQDASAAAQQLRREASEDQSGRRR